MFDGGNGSVLPASVYIWPRKQSNIPKDWRDKKNAIEKTNETLQGRLCINLKFTKFCNQNLILYQT